MYTTNVTSQLSHKVYVTQKLLYREKRLPAWLYRSWIAVTIALLLSLAWGGGRAAHAENRPGGNVADPVIRAVDIAQPAVVRIFTNIDSHLIVHFPQGGDVTFPQDNTKAYTLGFSGTGTFISAKGDILTADHVVNPPKDQTLNQYLNQMAMQDVAQYINQDPKKVGLSQTTPDQVLQQLNSGQLKSTTSYNQPASEVFLSTAYTGPQSVSDINQVPPQLRSNVDSIKAQSAVNQKDLAIVHANFSFDTPSVQLGDSSNVQTQDQLTIIGFPGNGDVSQKPTDLLTSSVNDIKVSSIKSTDNGAPVIQVGGNVEHGDSGGPALDSQGQIVGVVSFGLSPTNAQDQGGGTSFLQASNSARDLVSSIQLDTTPGQFQKLWTNAFNEYASTSPGHWHRAQQGFEQIAASYPQFNAVQPYLNYSKIQAQQESAGTQPTPTGSGQKGKTSATPSLTSIPALALTIAVIAALVLLSVAFMAVTLRRRKKKDKKTPPATPAPAASDTSATGTPASNNTTPSATSTPTAQTAAPASTNIQAGTPIQGTMPLRIWPCGHRNRVGARFCSVCGEPAPEAPTTTRPAI